ncbi:hypothetical protein JCM10450v2_000188 [Rhodotorula kratochvilovae]
MARQFYRHPLFAALVVAWTAFCLPGSFGALNGLGAAGQVDATTSNIANAACFGTIALGGLFSGALVNRIGFKWSLILGSVGYAPYAASFYWNNHTGGTWFVIFGAVILDPGERQKGKAVALKFIFQNAGGSLGGIISLALNANNSARGGVSDATYYAFITIMCLALPVAFLLPSPDKIERSDGTKVQLHAFRSWSEEVRGLWQTLSDRRVWILLPFLFYYQFDLAYMWNFNAAYHSVRARALMSLLFYLVGPGIGGALVGLFLDSPRWSRSLKARIAVVALLVSSLGIWIFGLVVQYQYRDRVEVIDYPDPAFANSVILFMLYGFLENTNVILVYWLIGTWTSSPSRLSSYAGVVNGVGSLGTVIAFVLGATHIPLVHQLWANVATFAASVPGLLWVAWRTSDANEDEGGEGEGARTPEEELEEKEGGKALPVLA